MKIWINLSNFITQHSDVCGKDTTYEYCPENNMARIGQTQKFIIHSSMMNPDEDPDEHQHSNEEHSNILMFILKNTTIF